MIYVIAERGTGLVKIGYVSPRPSWSLDAVRARLSTLQCGNPRPLSIVALVHGTRADERRVHDRFSARRVSGEWFGVDDALTEWIKEAAGNLEAITREHDRQTVAAQSMAAEQRARAIQERQSKSGWVKSEPKREWTWRGIRRGSRPGERVSPNDRTRRRSPTGGKSDGQTKEPTRMSGRNFRNSSKLSEPIAKLREKTQRNA